jgi:DNA-binding NarL/FixJ family response regulator
MRVLLVGRAADRARLRPQLIHAGWEIVSESAAQPAASAWPEDVDAIVVASSSAGGPFSASDAPGDEIAEPLTARERDVLALLAEGLPNKAIANALGISDQTVKFHVAAIIGKLGATNRTDAVRRAVRQGLVAL